jgi:hypothetical protein
LVPIDIGLPALKVKNSRSINDLLESGRLRGLQARRRERCDVLGHVRAALPPDLEATVLTAGIEEGRLTVGVSGGAWASRLRYRSQALRERVAETLGREIHSVRIKVVHVP